MKRPVIYLFLVTSYLWVGCAGKELHQNNKKREQITTAQGLELDSKEDAKDESISTDDAEFHKEERAFDHQIQDDIIITYDLELGPSPSVITEEVTDVPANNNESENIPQSGNTSVAGAGASPPSKVLHLKISIQNRQNCPMWYILPSKGEINLSSNGRFLTIENTPQECFMLQSYQGQLDDGNQSVLSEVSFEGQDKNSFKAFLLSPGKTMTIRNYPLISWKDTDKIDIASSPSLMIDDKTRLEEWFPAALLTATNVAVHCNKGESCMLDQEIIDIGDKDLSFIQARQYRMYQLPLKN